MKRKPKVGVLGLRGIPRVMGGIETHCENLYPYIVEAGADITLFARRPYVNPGLKEFKGVKLCVLPCIKNKYLETYFHTLLGVFAARLHGIDLLHIHAVGPGLFVPLARLLGMKVVFTHHGYDYRRQKWNRLAQWVLQTGEFLACTYAHAVITVADYIAEHVQKEFRRQAYSLPNGIAAPSGHCQTEILAKYGLTQNHYIFALGRFVPEKGFHDLIQAYQAFLASGPKMGEFKLVIAGRADHQDQYSQTLLKHAGENIVFTDFISGDTLHSIFSQARLFVIPSYHEGLPLALLEALGYGLSALASDIPAHREIPLESDRYFKPGDIAALAEKMSAYCFQTGECNQKQMMAWIKEKYSWERNARETYSVYRHVWND